MQLSVHRVTSMADPMFAAFHELYCAAFPDYQRREQADIAATFRLPEYRLDAWSADGDFAAVMSWWEFPDMRYVENLAVTPAKRSLGIGQKMLGAWLPTADTPAVLEIDPVVDELTRRRLAFYRRLGFVKNNITHTVPSLVERSVQIPGELLSWPRPFSREEYDRLQAHLDKTAFACIGHRSQIDE